MAVISHVDAIRMEGNHPLQRIIHPPLSDKHERRSENRLDQFGDCSSVQPCNRSGSLSTDD